MTVTNVDRDGFIQMKQVERGLWMRFLFCGSSEPVQRPGSTN